MRQSNKDRSRPGTGRTLGIAAAALLCAALLGHPPLAYAAPHGGGGFHRGGGFHGGGEFHGGGGFHGAGGFHGERFGGSMGREIRPGPREFRGDRFRGGGFDGARQRGFAGLHHGFADRDAGHWNYGWRNGGYGWWWGAGWGWPFYPYLYGYYPYVGYYGYDEPSSSQTWYYCSDPAGYYPYVTQCVSGWQTVPAG